MPHQPLVYESLGVAISRSIEITVWRKFGNVAKDGR